jgi:hypothetical protein
MSSFAFPIYRVFICVTVNSVLLFLEYQIFQLIKYEYLEILLSFSVKNLYLGEPSSHFNGLVSTQGQII